MTKDKLIEEMPKCYDNGDAMFELAEEYFKQQSCMICKHINNCETAYKIKKESGFKLSEMRFYCYEDKIEKV